MDQNKQLKQDRLARFQEDLRELKAALPGRCSASKESAGAHDASPAHWQKIEDLEEEIKALAAELADGSPA